MYKLLLVEDDDRLRAIVDDYFTAKGFYVYTAANGADALGLLQLEVYDIVLLDIMLPYADGFAVCRAVRGRSGVPVVFLTARSREEDMLLGYELGADDYVTKPFSLPVLHAKVLTLIARARNKVNAIYEFDGLTVNTQNRAVTAGGKPVYLAPKAYDLLLYLIENKGIVLSRAQILNAVWDYAYDGDERAVDTHVKKLRKALGRHAGCIRTVIKGGYCFEEK